MTRRLTDIMRVAASISVAAMLSSCFTGIESTPKITASDVRKEGIKETAESRFLTDISGQPVGEWQPGKRFFVTDDRIAGIFGASANGIDHLAGQTITFSGLQPVVTITGEDATDMAFSTPDGHTLVYRTSAPVTSPGRSLLIPFTVEESVVDEVRHRLKGNSYYVMTSMWYDLSGESLTGRKFVATKVEEVLPGNNVYPVRLMMSDAGGRRFMLFMSVGSSAKAPRGFNALFSFTDPRKRYPHITDETWAHIINGRVTTGMTRDECRLSLGSPAKVNHGNDRSYVYETWNYENGIYLVFQDGVLERYRR